MLVSARKTLGIGSLLCSDRELKKRHATDRDESSRTRGLAVLGAAGAFLLGLGASGITAATGAITQTVTQTTTTVTEETVTTTRVRTVRGRPVTVTRVRTERVSAPPPAGLYWDLWPTCSSFGD